MASLKKKLLIFSLVSSVLFTLTSYLIYLESFKELDLNLMIKIQSIVPRSFDRFFSYFSFFGNADITVTLIGALALYNFFRAHFKTALAWLLIVPATFIELIQKIFLYHPSPPSQFLRTIKTSDLPTIHLPTEFSFASGHSLRAAFLGTVLIFLIIYYWKVNVYLKTCSILVILILISIMLFSRISLGEHWLSDVLGGLFLGIFFAGLASKLILEDLKFKKPSSG